jgi:CubicO group peptidase (beta-lactamase class C family)
MRILAALLAVLAMQLAPVAQSPGNLVISQFENYLEALRIQAGVPGLAATIVGEHSIVWERGFGRQDLEQVIPVTPDTAFQLDGLTQIVTASLVLRCVEEGRVTLDDPIGIYDRASVEPAATIRDILTHTSGSPGAAAYAYRPERFAPLQTVIRSCTGNSFRETVANTLEQIGMYSSVPGADVVTLTAPAEGLPELTQVARYSQVLSRLAVPYGLDFRGSTFRTQYSATTLTPASGLVSTVRDFALFDLALKRGLLMGSGTRTLTWQVPLDQNLQPLPHGLGWFVQSYRGEPVAWQFGLSEQASSSLAVTLPARGLTLILLANSDGLVKPFALTGGDLTASPFGRVFLGLFVP